VSPQTAEVRPAREIRSLSIAAEPPEPAAPTGAASCFLRVLVGIDGSEAGLEAVRHAARLVSPDGRLELFSAAYLIEALLAGWSPSRTDIELARDTRDAIYAAVQIAGRRVITRAVSGPPLEAILHEVDETDATLAVVGTHGRSRLSELLVGGVAGGLLRAAPCSVLIARPPTIAALFPRSIVVGTDGSWQADGAVAVARQLARRFGAQLRIVAASRDRSVDLARAQQHTPLEVVDRHPVRALVEASAGSDLLVVGSRGLTGLSAIGSVSERAAHQASCSVMVVRLTGG
jgi:nucleotide-binding universal stress UspA family protein